MKSSESENLARAIRSLRPKEKMPNSARVLNTWIAQAERQLHSDGGRLGWLVASTVVAAALQQAVDEQGMPLFLLKGGTLLQHRLPGTSRATSDLDGLVRGDLNQFLEQLEDSLDKQWGPCTFVRGPIETINVPNRVVKPRRFDITVQLGGSTWRRIQVEVSPDEGYAGSRPELVQALSLTGFGLPSPDHLVGLAMGYQVAQKVHAATDPHDPPAQVNNRARDVVDLLLVRDLAEATGHPSRSEIRGAIEDIFDTRAEEAEATGGIPREWPARIVVYPNWETDFRAAINSVGLHIGLDDAVDQVNTWLDHIEHSSQQGQWPNR